MPPLPIKHAPASNPSLQMRARGGAISASSFAFLVFLLALLLSSCRDRESTSTTGAALRRPMVQGVTLSEVHSEAVEEYYETAGTVKAQTTAAIAAKVMGTVKSVRVRQGDSVMAGQILVTIEANDLDERVNAAVKAVESARAHKEFAATTLDRFRTLYQGKAVTRQEFDDIETKGTQAVLDYERARAMLAEARAVQDHTTVTAPFPGVVSAKLAEEGSVVAPGTPLLFLEDRIAFQVETPVDESLATRIALGMPVTVSIASMDKETSGEIVEISPAIDPRTRTFPIKVALTSADRLDGGSAAGGREGAGATGLRSGLYARVSILAGTRQALLLPQEALVAKGQLTGVYVVSPEGLVTYRLVRPGARRGDMVEIVAGLDSGETVITGNVDRAVDGGLLAPGVRPHPSGGQRP